MTSELSQLTVHCHWLTLTVTISGGWDGDSYAYDIW